MDAMDRRNFLKSAVSGIAVVAALPVLLNRTARADDAACKDKPLFVVPGKDMAAGVKYTEDASKADKALQIDRQGVPFAKQTCKTCAVFTADPTSADYGKCKIFGAKCQVVKTSGWCMTWSKGKGV